MAFRYFNSAFFFLEWTFQIAKTISRFLLALSFSGNLVIYCTTSDLFRRVLWQQITFVWHKLCPRFCWRRNSRNLDNGSRSPDASFAVTDTTRITTNRITNERVRMIVINRTTTNGTSTNLLEVHNKRLGTSSDLSSPRSQASRQSIARSSL